MRDLRTRAERDLLLRLALGEHAGRIEHRFRHKRTGEVREVLDLRTDRWVDWQEESRLVIETPWTTP